MEERVTEEEFRRLLTAARGQPPRTSGGFVRFVGDVFQMVLVGAAIVGIYFLLNVFLGSPAALPPPPTNAQGSPPPAPRPMVAPVAQPGTTYSTNSLPSCATVQDTRTACDPPQEEQAPAAVQELPTEAPAPTATPPYLSNCETPPGERPCWLPADQPWQPPAEVPATPIVAVDDGWHAPLALPADPCADWHPPAPYPEGCGE